MTRCDALIEASLKMLEQFRPMLDSTGAPIRSVVLEFKITPTNHVRSVFLSPEFESHYAHRPAIERYSFEEK
jgi:hypothetical protein